MMPHLSLRGSFSLVAGGLLLLVGAKVASAEPAATPKGLYLRHGALMRAGQPYAGIGANYDTLLGRLIGDKHNTSTLTNLGLLAKKGIPFVRFRASGFFPKDWDLYLRDKPEYFRRFDLVVRAAERDRIGLIPSLFFKLGTVPRIVGEPASEFGNPQSKTIAMMKQYTREVVTRYRDSPAIWGWEFGNAPNEVVDLPGKGRNAPPFNPTDEDSAPPVGRGISTAQFHTALVIFAQTVRSIDPTRIIESGSAVPRPGAWHRAHGQTGRDHAAQTYDALATFAPDPMDVTSIHVYLKPQHLAPWGPETLSHFLGRFVQETAARGKPLFIGEFPLLDRARATEALRAIKENRVPLSAFWVFDHPSQEAHMNVSFENERAFLLELVAQANRELGSSVGAATP